jgi:hypothetical protein
MLLRYSMKQAINSTQARLMDKKYGVSLENDQTSTIIDLNGIFVIFPFKIVLHNRLVYHFKSLSQIECFHLL